MEGTRTTFFVILFVTIAVVLGVLSFIFVDEQQTAGELAGELTLVAEAAALQQMTLTWVAEITPAPTATPTVVPTDAPNYLATTQVQATATASADAALIAEALAWPLVLDEAFDDNAHGWALGQGDDEYSLGDRLIDSGEYIWELEAVSGFFWIEVPTRTQTVKDFYLSSTVVQSEPGRGEQRIVFRFQDYSNFYYFGLCEGERSFDFGRRVNGEWFTLSNCRQSPHIRSAGRNTLSVLGKGDRFMFFVNDQLVGEVRDNSLETGSAGVYIEMDAGDINRYSYEDFKLRALVNRK